MRAVFVLAFAALSSFAADPSLMRMVPADAKMIAGIDVQRSSASQFGQFLLARMQKDDPGFREFIAATGFDPRRDVREVLVVANDTAPKGKGLLLIRGTFDVTRLLSHAKAKGANTSKFEGVDVITAGQENAGWFALLDSHTAAAGDEATVKAALARRTNPAPLEAATAAKVNDLSARYEAWMISSLPINHFARHAPDKTTGKAMTANMMQGIEQVSGGVKLGATVQIDGEADTRSEKDAQALVDVVKFLTGMVQLNRDKAPEADRVAQILESMQMRIEGDIVKMSVSIPESQLERWIMEPRGRVRRASR